MKSAYPQPLDEAIQAAAAALLPPVRVSLSEWADQNVRLSSEGSVQPGSWQCFPYQREPLDAMGPQSAYQQVVLMWASQTGNLVLLKQKTNALDQAAPLVGWELPAQFSELRGQLEPLNAEARCLVMRAVYDRLAARVAGGS